MAEHLPAMSKALSSIPTSIKPIIHVESWVWWCKPVIRVLRAMLRVGIGSRVTEFEASLGY